MLDFHTHLLPGMDDGSRSTEESRTLLKELESLGFDRLALTPHFYPHMETCTDFLRRRNLLYMEFCENNPEKKLYSGCECYLHEYIFHAEDISELCFAGTRLLLTELVYDADGGEYMLLLVRKLINTYNVIPVLSHIERYPYIMKNEKFFEEFLSMGCLAQVNLMSFSDFFRKNRLAKYFEKDYIHFIGTDTHRLPFDRKIYAKADKFLTAHFGNWREAFNNAIYL